ncbi:fimbria/pilus outer membrane usher protein [Providencia sp. wls1921]|uniref:fimbria/pilus outer membrane usher protein n=1 Tax=Providencia sp. wls1921 TaxID=2675153 RepID=UPI0012B5E6F8|nr:fimbria/pilus outer membrane usher protein [Providencia sp. wls1921]MTC44037.1 fimbria/pilus outer membrane usher protein [Providencia sp. wls1921]
MNKFKQNIVTSLISSLFLYSNYVNADSVQFNQDALSISGDTNIDLSSFEKNHSQEGAYFSNVSINGRRTNFFDKIDFFNKEGSIQPCISQKIIDVIGLKEEFINKIPTWSDGQCYDLSAQDDNISSLFDDEKQELSLSIPQAYFLYSDENWVPPMQREVGINALVFDYNIVENYIKYKNAQDTNNLSSFGAIGTNMGRWRFRSNYQFQKDFNNSNNDSFKWVQTYLFTDLPDLSAKFFVGKYYTASQIFDSVRFNGVSVFTDDNMLPSILRGYAPNITGTATSNATVVISQNGRILSQVKVAPGPFSIDNLSSALSGTLDVKITEEDGSVREYQISSTNIPFLTRPGMFQYKLNAGRLAPMGENNVDNDFISTEFSWGLFNNLSVFGGLFSTSDSEYIAYNAGLGINMERLGAISFDITQSKNRLHTTNSSTGESYRINYAKRFSNSSRLDLTGYQFSNEGFMSVNNFIYTKGNPSNHHFRQKNVFTTSFTQQIPDFNADVSLSYSRESYWNEPKNNDTLSVSFNKTIKNDFFDNALLSLSVSESSYVRGSKSKQAYLSLSIPFVGEKNSRLQYFSSYNDQDKKYSNNVNYHTKIDSNNLSLGLSTRDFFENTTINASASRDTQYGTAQITGSLGDDYRTLSGTLDGSLTITSQGPVLHRRVYDNQARMVIDTDNAKDVSINQNESITNRFGLAAISNVPTYYKSTQYVDLNNIPENVSVDDSVIESTLTDGAVGYAKLNTIIGEKALITIKFPDGKTPPFGALVYDSAKDTVLGMVAENGQVYLTGIQPNQKLIVKWNGGQSCQLVTDSQIIQNINNVICNKE